MTAKNEHTGDYIKTKAGNDAYGDGWDRIFKQKKIDEQMEKRLKALDDLVEENQRLGLYDEAE